MFGERYFGRYFGDRYFGTATSTVSGYFGHHYFGARHFGAHYFGPEFFAGTGDATATGGTIVATTSLVSGTATGNRQQHSGSFGIPRPYRIIQADGQAKGAVVKCSASLLAGSANGRRVSIIAGQATADANVEGVELTQFTVLKSGYAGGERNWSDDELMILLEAA